MIERDTRRVLVVIDRAILDIAAVPQTVLEAEAQADQVRVIAPVLTTRTGWLTNDDRTARQAASDRLSAVLHRMWVEQGISASGGLGDESPLRAIEDALVEFPADRLIFIMHDDDQRSWQEREAAAKIRRQYGSRLTEVIVVGNTETSTAGSTIALCGSLRPPLTKQMSSQPLHTGARRDFAGDQCRLAGVTTSAFESIAPLCPTSHGWIKPAKTIAASVRRIGELIVTGVAISRPAITASIAAFTKNKRQNSGIRGFSIPRH